ncbi:phosphatidylserine decarboxylase [Candidatus Kapabacteria bacterium]|nr:phosphatidylserine decarboxylase [Candidatus Kapabacteria bacterium]
MLTKYGTDNIIVMLLVGAILVALPYFITNRIVGAISIALGVLLIVFTFVFFRDPDRIIPDIAKEDQSVLLSPADGKVVEIVNEIENEYIKDSVTRVSIFLSPLNVHVNRSPASGVVKFLKYKKGEFLPAYVPKSSELNEQSKIGVENEYGKVFFKQITGMVARRIVYDIKEGDTLNSGDKFGMMKFSSRMDVSFSPNTKLDIKVGDKVVGGETVIGKLVK